MPLLRAGAGCSPRRARHFSLLRQRKVPKRKATPSLRPLRCATGQTCGGAAAGCAAELTALRGSSVRTAAASQFTKHARSDARATPQPPRRRRSQQGVNTQTAIRVFAALDPKNAAPCARCLRAQQRAERSNGPRGCLAVWLPPLCMRRGAQRPADQGSRLSERSAAQRVRARPRQTLRSSAHPEGYGGQNIHTGHCFARPPDRGRKRLALRSLGRAQQWPEWMSGCSVVWMFGCPPPAGCACGGAVVG